jgi:TPR repeat protein
MKSPLHVILPFLVFLLSCNTSDKKENQELIYTEIDSTEIDLPETRMDTVSKNSESSEENLPIVKDTLVIAEKIEPKIKKKDPIKFRGAGEAERLYKLAEKYEFGDGVKKDINKAIELYRQSAELNYAKAQYSLAFLIKDEKESLGWLRKSAEQGYSGAQYELGIQYLYGYGVNQDVKESTYWFEQSAENGHKIAQYKLGLMYDVGEGVKQDLKKAANYYKKSAEQGVGNAQFNLAMMYITGEGLDSVNMKQAAFWMDQARDAGIKDAKKAWNKFGLEYFK